MAVKSVNKKARRSIVVATLTTIFTLFTAMAGTYAWFASSTSVTTTGMQVIVQCKSSVIESLKLIKFDYDYDDTLQIYNYLDPSCGGVNTYTYDPTYDNNNGGFIFNKNGNPIEAELMTKYDPVDKIIHGDNLREMNCNSIYEVTITSTSYIDCYLQLKAIYDQKTASTNEILLSDCVDFEIFYPEDLANNSRVFYNPSTGNYDAYYPSFDFDDTQADDILYHKISYISYLKTLNLSAEDLVDMEILDAEDIAGKTTEQKEELVEATLGSKSVNFYSQANKNVPVSIASNKPVTFTGEPKTITAYINVNYAPSELEQYSTDIYRNSLTAITDLYFEFDFTETEVS